MRGGEKGIVKPDRRREHENFPLHAARPQSDPFPHRSDDKPVGQAFERLSDALRAVPVGIGFDHGEKFCTRAQPFFEYGEIVTDVFE